MGAGEVAMGVKHFMEAIETLEKLRELGSKSVHSRTSRVSTWANHLASLISSFHFWGVGMITHRVSIHCSNVLNVLRLSPGIQQAFSNFWLLFVFDSDT